MKKIFYTLLFLLPLFGFSQTTPKPKAEERIVISKRLTALPGEFYVDNVKVDMEKTILDPGNIKMVKVFYAEDDKGKNGAKGATLIIRKSQPHLFALSDLVNSLKKDFEKLKDAGDVKVFIDKKEIKDLSGYLIEKSAIEKVDIKVDETGQKDKAVPEIIITVKQPKNRKKSW